jgi:hypothetical protein
VSEEGKKGSNIILPKLVKKVSRNPFAADNIKSDNSKNNGKAKSAPSSSTTKIIRKSPSGSK